MGAKSYTVQLCLRSEVKEFVEKWHYSHSLNGVVSDYCFGMFDKDGVLIGAAVFGRMAMANQWRKYGTGSIELRRLCCVDDTYRNAESYFIGKCLKWLKQNTDLTKVVSYSDLYYGHSGVIYKASNFNLLGQTTKGKVISYLGKLYHDKTVRSKHNGVFKPYALKLRKAVEDGLAVYESRPPKNIYIYNLR